MHRPRYGSRGCETHSKHEKFCRWCTCRWASVECIRVVATARENVLIWIYKNGQHKRTPRTRLFSKNVFYLTSFPVAVCSDKTTSETMAVAGYPHERVNDDLKRFLLHLAQSNMEFECEEWKACGTADSQHVQRRRTSLLRAVSALCAFAGIPRNVSTVDMASSRHSGSAAAAGDNPVLLLLPPFATSARSWCSQCAKTGFGVVVVFGCWAAGAEGERERSDRNVKSSPFCLP